MKTIVPAKENIAKLWGHPKPKDTTYRLMKYLLKVEVNEGTLLHNVVTGQLILLTPDEMAQLSHLPNKPCDFIEELVENHFLVPEEYDEYKSVKQLRMIYRARSTGDAINHYVILPTTFCNAHCFYCYESDYPHIHMTEETAHKVVDYIAKNHEGKHVSIHWFGGEPLVGIARIDQISRELQERGIKFGSTMTSNGYLFDADIIQRSVDNWHLERVQITLDGTEATYNRVKAYSNVTDNPFVRVLHNIDELSAKKVHVNIRLNVDFYNKDDIRELIEIIGKHYSGKKYVSVYLNMLFSGTGYEPIEHTQDDIILLLKIIADYTARLRELGLSYESRKLPSLEISQCMADNQHSVLIQPDGSFCRCEHETVSDSYGNIDVGIVDSSRLAKWKESIEKSESCSQCCIYPYCYHLKNCFSANEPCIECVRKQTINRLEDTVVMSYASYMEDKSNEGVQDS